MARGCRKIFETGWQVINDSHASGSARSIVGGGNRVRNGVPNVDAAWVDPFADRKVNHWVDPNFGRGTQGLAVPGQDCHVLEITRGVVRGAGRNGKRTALTRLEVEGFKQVFTDQTGGQHV